MKRVGFIQARMGSSRLPGKVLKKVGDATLLEILIDRVSQSKSLDEIVILTTGRPDDDPIYNLCENRRIRCCRGSQRDVLDRFYRGATEIKADLIVRITADCPLIDPAVIDRVVNKYLESKNYDFVANTVPPPGTFPDGMDVEVFSFNVLEKVWKEATRFSDREHVTFYIWKNPGLFKIYRVDNDRDLSLYRLTVDYEEDFKLIKVLLNILKENDKFGSLNELIEIIDKYPELKKLNQKYKSGEGWKPALAKDKLLKKKSFARAEPLNRRLGNRSWRKAIKLIPGGAQTFSKGPGQYVDGVAPKMLHRGIGCRVWDIDGNEFIDYVLGLGPIILGHSNKEVNDAVFSCADDLFVAPSLPHTLETKLSEKLVKLIPCAEMVKFGKNGSDVTAGAVRLARAITKRNVIACCGYHGWQDWYIGSTTRNLGVPQCIRKLTIPFQYNNIESIEKIFKDKKDNVACVIIEPVTFYPPKNDFLHRLRDLCNKHKTILIFDEIITGFRAHIGGAQSLFGVKPDLATFGKAMANGYPISAICGKALYMRRFKDVFFSFTFGGELPAISAAITTIDILERDNVLWHINQMGERFIKGYRDIKKDLDISFTNIIGYGWWPEYEFKPTHGYTSREILTLFQQELVKRGILTRPAPFISFAHKGSDIHETLTAMAQALAVVKYAVTKKKLKKLLEGRIIQPVIRAKEEMTKKQ
ncbi:MAG: aminotransferase class III-fold pyridoxal phosphate-dependent enzyme [Candidatus Hydrogenedentota bacterium]